MLSYIHAFHAGNAADVLKHATISLALEILKQKEKPLCVIDTHAGSGIYSLFDERATKTAEAEDGIIKLLFSIGRFPKEILPFLSADFVQKNEKPIFNESLEPYLKIVLDFLKNAKYPGSPAIESTFLDENDDLILNELHPKVFEELRENAKSFAKKPQIHRRDSWEFALAITPPKIKRGIMIIDPSYEDDSDWEKCAQTVQAVQKKWNAGIFAIWYPVLAHRVKELSILKEKIAAIAPGKTLDVQIITKDFDFSQNSSALCGSGMIFAPAPWKLDEKISVALPQIAKSLNAKEFSLKTL